MDKNHIFTNFISILEETNSSKDYEKNYSYKIMKNQ